MKRVQFLIMVSLVMLFSIQVNANHDDYGPPGIYAVQTQSDFDQVDPLLVIQNNAELQTELTEGRIAIPGSDLTKFPNQGSAIMSDGQTNYKALLTGSVAYTEFNLPIEDQWSPEAYRPPAKIVG